MPIKMQPEPLHFYKKVQKKGEAFLSKNPGAKGSKLPTYWRAIIPDLHKAYNGICAYTCHWIPFDTGSVTVEHYDSKEFHPQKAYLWSNYRLICGLMNGRKGTNKNVLDPFTLQDGWFEIQFPSLQLKAGKHLTEEEAHKVLETIKILDLNGHRCVQGRLCWLTPYLDGKYGIEYLEKMAPFLASELKRQCLDDRNHPMWAAYRKPEKTS
jgi:hypothetical protein